MAGSIDQLRAEIEAALGQAAGGAARVTALRPIAGGASRETWAFDATIDSGPAAGSYALVMRRDMAASMNPAAIGRAEEFQLLQAAHTAGVCVPRPRWLVAEAAQPFFLMDRVEGESIGRRVVREPALSDARRVLPAQMAEQLARIHAIDPATPGLGFLPRPAGGETPAAQALARLSRMLRELGVADALFALAIRWLRAHIPPAGPLTVLHGDFRVGNLIVGPEGLHAVIDWEFAHLGDPHEDLAWPAVRDWRFGRDDLHLGGVGDLEPFLSAYEHASGRAVDRGAVRYWEMMGNLMWGVACLSQANRHLSGADPSVELASLGRRSAEMQWELLRLIEVEINRQTDP
jgi:aminoglycoside phosphotransferase (APT) family kinase protein